ncbi:MAG: PEP-CTERM sorting domain-containing protein [Lentisphaeria bacterium]|jgi:hypothetical protein
MKVSAMSAAGRPACGICRMPAALAATVFAGALFTSLPAAAAPITIYSDDFTHAAGDLNGNTVQASSGTDGGTLNATWSSVATLFNYSGAGVLNSTTNGVYDYAVLPFTPVAGKVYTLTAVVDPTNSTSSSTLLAVGFANSTATSNSTFTGRNPWVGYNPRGTGAAYSSGTTSFDTFGTAGSSSEPITVTLTLDTQNAAWATTYTVAGATISDTATFTYATNPTIAAVYLGNVNTSGTFDNFALTVVPEPSALVLLGAGALALGGPRRKRARSA